MLILKLLHELGADLTKPNNAGYTLAHSAAHYGHVDVIKLLIELKFDLNVKGGPDGETPKSSAEKNQKQAVVDAINTVKEIDSPVKHHKKP